MSFPSLTKAYFHEVGRRQRNSAPFQRAPRRQSPTIMADRNLGARSARPGRSSHGCSSGSVSEAPRFAHPPAQDKSPVPISGRADERVPRQSTFTGATHASGAFLALFCSWRNRFPLRERAHLRRALPQRTPSPRGSEIALISARPIVPASGDAAMMFLGVYNQQTYR